MQFFGHVITHSTWGHGRFRVFELQTPSHRYTQFLTYMREAFAHSSWSAVIVRLLWCPGGSRPNRLSFLQSPFHWLHGVHHPSMQDCFTRAEYFLFFFWLTSSILCCSQRTVGSNNRACLRFWGQDLVWSKAGYTMFLGNPSCFPRSTFRLQSVTVSRRSVWAFGQEGGCSPSCTY